MNQAIQVLDGFTFCKVHHAFKLECICNGQIIPCYIKDVTEAQSTKFYSEQQFSIECVIEEMDIDQSVNEQGELWLTRSAFNI